MLCISRDEAPKAHYFLHPVLSSSCMGGMLVFFESRERLVINIIKPIFCVM
jgi:hypothetical protein